MLILLYELLTQIIILISQVRERLWLKMYIRFERKIMTNLIDFPLIGLSTQIKCCDCGCRHYFYVKKKMMHVIPVRPKNYKYKLRYGGIKRAPSVQIITKK